MFFWVSPRQPAHIPPFPIPGFWEHINLPRGATCPTEGCGSGRRSLLKNDLADRAGRETSVPGRVEYKMGATRLSDRHAGCTSDRPTMRMVGRSSSWQRGYRNCKSEADNRALSQFRHFGLHRFFLPRTHMTVARKYLTCTLRSNPQMRHYDVIFPDTGMM
jgi:hypothetical protein